MAIVQAFMLNSKPSTNNIISSKPRSIRITGSGEHNIPDSSCDLGGLEGSEGFRVRLGLGIGFRACRV